MHHFVSLLLQGPILRKYSLEMSEKVGECDRDWRVDKFTADKLLM